MCDKNPQKINQIFDSIASYYDKMNNYMSFFTHKLIKKYALRDLNIKPNSKVLDLCCGTGDFCSIINSFNRNTMLIGVDNSQNMLKIAKQKNPKLVFVRADCTKLPFSEEFSYVTMGFGLRNIENRTLAISQIYKSLKVNGEFLHLDFGNHNFASKIFDFIVMLLIKLHRADAKSYEYLLESKNSFPQPAELIKEFERAGFKFVKRKDFLFGVISYQIMRK